MLATVTVLRARPDSDSITLDPATPRWLDDDAAVDRALTVKRNPPPSPHCWERLAVLAQLGRAVVNGPPNAREGVVCAGLLVRELAAELPDPGITAHDPRRTGPVSVALLRRPPLVGHLADCVNELAVALANPRPSCLDGLSALLDELAVTLHLYRVTGLQRHAARSCHED